MGKCETEILTGKTYLFKSFRFRSNNYDCYVNTPKDLPRSTEQVADFPESSAQSDPTELTEIDAKLSLVLIETTNKYYLCLKCGSKICNSNEKMATCGKCSSLNKLKNCTWKVYMKILFKNSKREKILLSVYNDCVLQLLSLANDSADVLDLEEEIESAIMEVDVAAAYDCVSFCKLLNVQPVV